MRKKVDRTVHPVYVHGCLGVSMNDTTIAIESKKIVNINIDVPRTNPIIAIL